MKVEIELPEIEGYEYTGEYRFPIVGEYFLKSFKVQQANQTQCLFPRSILKKKRWRAEKDCRYFMIDNTVSVVDCFDIYKLTDDRRYFFGNYFKTEEQAEGGVESLKKLLQEYHRVN